MNNQSYSKHKGLKYQQIKINLFIVVNYCKQKKQLKQQYNYFLHNKHMINFIQHIQLHSPQMLQLIINPIARSILPKLQEHISYGKSIILEVISLQFNHQFQCCITEHEGGFKFGFHQQQKAAVRQSVFYNNEQLFYQHQFVPSNHIQPGNVSQSL
ncbi:unnamed protein product [Paramecium primaurelia]|uniref:Uncharacterized protein n=1 Tax=Paramecium primaurelia TaxID=5886 RepID=A0A8S1QML2_PARPR|nr:unnamed protein product [Paramecium primaurelia]